MSDALPPTDEPADRPPADWPPELCEQWAACELPSLGEFLVAQERLAVEVRRQNKALQRLQPSATAAPAIDDGVLQLVDAIDRLSVGLAAFRTDLDVTLPERQGWRGQPPPWRAPVLQAAAAQADGARMVAERLRDLLAVWQVDTIQPTLGTPFDPTIHRAVGVADGPAGTILAVERPGFSQQDSLLRPADVIVGQSQSKE